jgi:hypothetical protein
VVAINMLLVYFLGVVGKRSQGTVNMFSVAGIFGCLMGRT